MRLFLAWFEKLFAETGMHVDLFKGEVLLKMILQFSSHGMHALLQGYTIIVSKSCFHLFLRFRTRILYIQRIGS